MLTETKPEALSPAPSPKPTQSEKSAAGFTVVSEETLSPNVRRMLAGMRKADPNNMPKTP